MEPKGDCTIIGWGEENKVSPMASALINSTFIQGFELDDVNASSPLHNNSLLLPALLAASKLNDPSTGKTKPYTGADMLLSYIIGCETGPRVGLALGGADLLSRGWHSGTLMGPSSTAAAMSSLLQLPESQVMDALGIACTQAGGLMAAQFGSMAKRMQHGFACRNGLLAALLAQSGYTGIQDVYETPYGGFLSCFSQGSSLTPPSKPDEIVKELGTRWEVNNIGVKYHASMAALHGTIDCISFLQAKHPDRFKDITQISHIASHVSKAAYEHGGWKAPADQPLTPVAAQMSIQYAAACQCLDGQVLMVQFREDKLNRPELLTLMQKVEPILDESLTGATGWSTRVTITFADGMVLDERVPAPRFVKPGLTNGEIREKWRLLVRDLPGMSQERVGRIEELVLNLEQEREGAISRLADLLEGVVGVAIA
jgi:aconitate decarboxylase